MYYTKIFVWAATISPFDIEGYGQRYNCMDGHSQYTDKDTISSSSLYHIIHTYIRNENNHKYTFIWTAIASIQTKYNLGTFYKEGMRR
jgi:hypothetical protein